MIERVRAILGLVLNVAGYAKSETPYLAYLSNEEIDRRL